MRFFSWIIVVMILTWSALCVAAQLKRFQWDTASFAWLEFCYVDMRCANDSDSSFHKADYDMADVQLTDRMQTATYYKLMTFEI
jgi:hypothetical protein